MDLTPIVDLWREWLDFILDILDIDLAGALRLDLLFTTDFRDPTRPIDLLEGILDATREGARDATRDGLLATDERRPSDEARLILLDREGRRPDLPCLDLLLCGLFL